MAQMMRDLIRFFEKEAEFRCIEITLDIPEGSIEIESDQGNLQEIFLNLINNAFAAMEAGGRLEMGVKKEGPEQITIVIADNGHGIPPADLKRVFEPFFSTRTGQKGTGLGLSITYGLVKEIEGDIAVESKLGEGARFIITLPVKVQADKSQNTCQDVKKD